MLEWVAVKPIVLLDIDNTLLDVRKLGVLTGKHLKGKLNRALQVVTKRDWKGLRRLLKPEFQGLSYLLFGKPAGFLQSPSARASFLSPAHYQKSLFEDVLPTLEKLQRKASLGVFSQGLVRWQLAKLYLGGIERYFKRELVFIFPPRKVDKARRVLTQLPSDVKIYFVDDRPDVARILSNHRVKVFLIRRDSRPVSRNSRIISIQSLRGILELL